jgi:hypothetical protein
MRRCSFSIATEVAAPPILRDYFIPEMRTPFTM